MQLHRRDVDRIRSVLTAVDPDEPLTAREILHLLEDHGEEFDSAHRIATVLGRAAQQGSVEVIQSQPYRYRFVDLNS